MSQSEVQISRTEGRRLAEDSIRKHANLTALRLVNNEPWFAFEIEDNGLFTSVLYAGPEYFLAVSFRRGGSSVHINYFHAIEIFEMCTRRLEASAAPTS